MKRNRFLFCIFAGTLALGWSGCSKPLTLEPIRESAEANPAGAAGGTDTPGSVSSGLDGGRGESAAPVARFFCEDGYVYDSIRTFTAAATSSARSSRIFLDDPEQTGFLLTEVRNPSPLRSDGSTVELLFQASSLVPKGASRAGIYYASLHLPTRVGRAQLLSSARTPSANVLRVAKRLGIRLRSFGVGKGEAGAPLVVLAQKDGYRIVAWEEGKLSTELAQIPCPPEQCWNPEVSGNSVRFLALDSKLAQFRTRAFRWDEGVGSEWDYLDLPVSRSEIEVGVPYPENTKLLGLLTDANGKVYGNFKRGVRAELYRFNMESAQWEVMTRDACENPSWMMEERQ